MPTVCEAGECSKACLGNCMCMAVVGRPDLCSCTCFPVTQPASKRITRRQMIPFLRLIKENPQARYDICARNAPITLLAQSFDKVVPNRILVPANQVTKKVNLSLKNKTFRQIVIASGLALKS
ncbi:MAG TPA: hypothetical protein VIP29_06135 [Nitrososphaeraceae archaeon]